MKKHAMVLGVALVLVAGATVTLSAADEAGTAAQADVKKLADQVGKKGWDDLAKEGQPLAKKHELLDVMYSFKLRKPGAKVSGIGIGDKPGAMTPDGIEAKIINMARRVTPADLKADKELIRIAEISAAIAGIAVHQSPVQAPMGQKTPAKWKELSADMYKASKGLTDALKAPKKTTADVKKAAMKLNASCAECHTVFRDS